MKKFGRKDRPFGLRPPTKEEMEWVESWAKLYVSRVPKGVFKYKSHEEANADWDKWMAHGRFKPMIKSDNGLNSVILSELPEDEQGPFFQHLIDYGHTMPSPGQAFRWDYDQWKQSLQTTRDAESAMLDRCLAVAREEVAGAESAQDQREANVFRLAATAIQSRVPNAESKRLMDASEQYFAVHPTEELEPGEVVRKGWIISMPRLRDMLSERLGWHFKKSHVLLSDLPEEEREPFLQHLIEWGHILPSPGPGDPPYNIRAYRCDYVAWKLKPELG
jgi:hypothetical protein